MTPLLILLLPILGQACELERYVDYPGHDLANMPLNVRSEGDCSEQCYGNIRCDYWTFRPRDKKCWLKHGRNQRVHNRQDLVSGDKACGADCTESDVIERNIDYPENDIESRDGWVVIDQDACEERCTNNENCKYWSYSPKHKDCWLKSDKGGRFSVYPHPDRVSGKSKCWAGCVEENDIDYPNGDIRGQEQQSATNENACSRLCLNEAACNFWSFSPTQNACWLKHTKGVNGFIHGDADRISGNKACGNQRHVRTGNGKLCEGSRLRVINDQKECQDAATAFGLDWGGGWNGPGDHPGCMFADDDQRVYFNRSPSPRNTATPNYESICLAV